MKIPIISNIIERKYEASKKILDRLEEYHSIRKQPEICYDQSRAKIKDAKTKINRKNFFKVMWDLDNFLVRCGATSHYAIKNEKNTKITHKENPEQLKLRQAISFLERWTKDAKPIIEDIINKNPKAMDGFEYDIYIQFSNIAYSEGLSHEKMVLSDDNKFGFCSKNSMRDFGKPFFSKFDNPASEILNSLKPRGGYKTFNAYNSYNGNPAIVINELLNRRTYLINEIEKRTGRNLKREVILSRQGNN